MKLDARVEEVLRLLDENYKVYTKCHLDYNTPWQLLIATILSAQCTDARVNIVTPALFEKYPSVKAFAEAKQEELEQAIHSTGFYHNKSKNIILCTRQLLERYNGEIPSDIDELTALAGVGRKTANVIRGNIYNIPSIVVDTHVKRISKRLGFTNSEDPVKIEFELMKLLPEEFWIRYNSQVIVHGRTICIARRAKCDECFLNPCCPKNI
jgi:endonuclease-3